MVFFHYKLPLRINQPGELYMINFNESNRINLGNSGSGPYICSSYCILNERLILSLYEPISKKGKIAAFSINSNGTFTEVASSEVYPYVIAHTDGVFTDDTYIYQCLTTEESSNNRYTLAWGFSGDAFIYPSVVTKNIHSPHGQMVFGDGYIFSYSTESYSSPDVLVACKFAGSTWVFSYSTNEITVGYPLFYVPGAVIGIRYQNPDYGYFKAILDADLGFTVSAMYLNYYPNKSYLIESLYWNLVNDSVVTRSSPYYFDSALHTYDPVLPEGRAYHSPEDNILSICTSNGLYYYESDNNYKLYGVYEPTKSFYFNFRFGNFDIILDNDLIDGNYQMKSGKFVYCPDYTVDFYTKDTRGNTPLTAWFVDTTN